MMKIVYWLSSIPVLFSSPVQEQIKIAKGYEVAQHIDGFGQLRLDYFRGYPYFYDGDLVHERKYLQNYASNPKTLLVLSQTGALMGCPLRDMVDHNKPFLDGKMPIEEIYYLGELVFEPGREREDVQVEMYQQFEEEVRKMGYSQIAVYEIATEDNDPREPKGYVSIEKLWEKMGFTKQPEIALEVYWKEQGQEKLHRLIAWMKKV